MQLLRRFAAEAVTVVVLAGAAFAVADRIDSRRAAAWEARAEAAEAFAKTERARADSASARADTAAAHAVAIEHTADELRRQIRQRVAEVRGVVVPDTCAQFVAPRDSIIDRQETESGLLRASLALQRDAIDNLRVAEAALRVANDSLSTTLAARPRPRSRLIPSVGVGPFAGMCAGGPCYGVGVTLSWRVF